MRVGVVGAGRISAHHVENLLAHPAVSKVEIYDLDEGRARALAVQHDLAVASSTGALIEAADAVVIATPATTHVDLVVAAAMAGRPTFCEKPMGTDVDSVDRVIAVAEETGTPIQVGFNRRFDEGFMAAREAVDSESLGVLMTLVGHHHDHTPPPLDYVAQSGGQFADQLIHDFDLVRFVSGQEVVKVHAMGTGVGLPGFDDLGDHVASIVTLSLSAGALAVLVGVRTDPVGYDVRMELHGTADSIAVGLDERTPLRTVGSDFIPLDDPYRAWITRFGQSYRDEIDAFLTATVLGKGSPCTPADARAALVLAAAATRSAIEGRVVDVERNTPRRSTGQ